MKEQNEFSIEEMISVICVKNTKGGLWYLEFPYYSRLDKDNAMLLFRPGITKEFVGRINPLFSNIFNYIQELGFKKIASRSRFVIYSIDIAPEYIESVKNMLDLIISEVPANRELGYILFQNIKEYATEKL